MPDRKRPRTASQSPSPARPPAQTSPAAWLAAGTPAQTSPAAWLAAVDPQVFMNAVHGGAFRGAAAASLRAPAAAALMVAQQPPLDNMAAYWSQPTSIGSYHWDVARNGPAWWTCGTCGSAFWCTIVRVGGPTEGNHHGGRERWWPEGQSGMCTECTTYWRQQ